MSNETKNLGSLWLPLYKDAAQPTVQVAGKALGQVTSLILNPIGRCAEIAEKNAMRFLNKFDIEEKDDIVSPETSIAVPILQKLSYTEEDELVELYCELLKNACLKNQKSKVLPSYTNIISSLTPDEVNILNFLFKGNYIIDLPMHVIKQHQSGIATRHIIPGAHNNKGEQSIRFSSLPFLGVEDHESSTSSWRTIVKYFTDINERITLQNPDNIELYLDNINALGVLDIRKSTHIVPTEVYKHLKEKETIIKHKENIEKHGREMVLKKGSVVFTNLGSSFLAACTRKEQALTSNKQ